MIRSIDLPDDHELWLFGTTLLREVQDESDYYSKRVTPTLRW